uniref:Uncharacterized protein n=1 Tax=Photinus pyralis TaxID=7054 RepID=A0A1Y1L0K8_PHOPY
MNWERQRALKSSTTETQSTPKITDLMNFLRDEIAGLERLKFIDTLSMSKSIESTAAVLHSSTPATEQFLKYKDRFLKKEGKKQECLYCKKDNHILANCFAARKIPIKERLEFIKTHNLCKQCLRSHQ